MKRSKVIVSILIGTGIFIRDMSTSVKAMDQSPEGFNTTGTIVIPPGDLLLEGVQKNLDFGEIVLSDQTQVISKEGEITVSDYTNTFAGWNVRVAKKDINWDAHIGLSIDDKNNLLNSSFKPFRNQLESSYEVVQPKDFQVYLTVPSDAIPNNYSSKIIWSLVQGPENDE